MTLSNTDKSRLNRALKAAELSESKYQHGAAIYKGGSLMSIGVSVVKNDPLFVGEATRNPATHAEALAIRSCGPVDLSNATIYVARINNHGQPRFSKPCPDCQMAIDKAGIRKVIYTLTA